jgi:nickel transport protein
MQRFLVHSCLLSALALPVQAHDLWLERDGAGYTLYQGHKYSAHAGTETMAYDAAFVKDSRCLNAVGAVQALKTGQLSPWKARAECAALLVSASSGYWTKTPWETRNAAKTGFGDSLKSWLSEEAVKRIDAWTPGAALPLGDGLEITPLANPFSLKPGDKLTVLITERKRPRAGVPVAYGGETRGTSDDSGRIGIRIRHGGTQLLSASLETPLDDGKADSLMRAAFLLFELP